MEKGSAGSIFETAGSIADRLAALSAIQSQQASSAQRGGGDVFAAIRRRYSCVEVFFSARKDWGNRAYFPRAGILHPGRSAGLVLAQFYTTSRRRN